MLYFRCPEAAVPSLVRHREMDRGEMQDLAVGGLSSPEEAGVSARALHEEARALRPREPVLALRPGLGLSAIRARCCLPSPARELRGLVRGEGRVDGPQSAICEVGGKVCARKWGAQEGCGGERRDVGGVRTRERGQDLPAREQGGASEGEGRVDGPQSAICMVGGKVCARRCGEKGAGAMEGRGPSEGGVPGLTLPQGRPRLTLLCNRMADPGVEDTGPPRGELCASRSRI